MPEWYTPPQIARARGLRVGKVLAWIARGELEAVNCADRMGGRPRWRISAAALEAFDRARSSRVRIFPRPAAAQPKPPSSGAVIEFF